MKKLILHAGPHKTGTTSIQRSLSNSQEGLRNQGWTYEHIHCNSLTTHQLADKLSLMHSSAETDQVLQELNNKGENIVISSENFSRLSGDQMRRFLNSCQTKEVKIIYYLRNPVDRLMSSWKEWVKHGYSRTFPDYISRKLLNWRVDKEINESIRINEWKNILNPRSELIVHSYDQIEDIESHFLSSYFPGLNIVNSKGKYNVNASESALKTEIVRAMGGYFKHIKFNAPEGDRFSKLFKQILADFKDFDYVNYCKSIRADTGPGSILQRIEMACSKSCGKNQCFYDKKTHKWRYISSDIWLDERAPTDKLSFLINELHRVYGQPKIDVRLAKY